jgi:FAD/FMN-containing dehydrogenase
MTARTAHAERAALAAAQLRASSYGDALGLAKPTSNLFRDRAAGAKRRLDLAGFNHVLAADSERGTVDAEGLVTFEDLVAATLPHGAMPAVVPQLKTITLGGAAAGVGIEATSFRHGLVHDTLTEIEVLLPGGNTVVCTPDNEHADLFFGFPNSYGTLGYALRLTQRTLPVKPYVRVEHFKYDDPAVFFRDLAARCEQAFDFIDGVVFGPRFGTRELVLSCARFVDAAPWLSDYTFERIYYRSLREKDTDYLSVHDYLWRWDTDWFWCSKNLGAQNPILRRLLGRKRLNSRFYTRVMRLNSRWGFTRALARLRGSSVESVIQDVDIPIARAPEFLDFLLREIGVLPIWICPIGPAQRSAQFTLYPLATRGLYVNFGFWDAVARPGAHAPGELNRKIERQVIALGGIKSLYSDSYFDRDTFARAYALDAYAQLKRKYDPQGRALGLYEKCVLKR